MRTWIVPSNPKRFRLIDLLKHRDTIYWMQHVNFEPGDMVFIYSAAPYSRIMFEMEVVEVNLPYGKYADQVEQSKYWVNPSDYEVAKKHNRCCKFKFIRSFDSTSLRLANLKVHGLKAAPQGSMSNLPKLLLDYILSQP